MSLMMETVPMAMLIFRLPGDSERRCRPLRTGLRVPYLTLQSRFSLER